MKGLALKAYQLDVVDEFSRWYKLFDEANKEASDKKRVYENSNLPKETIEELLHKAEPKLEDIWDKFKGNNGSEWKKRTGPARESIPHVCIKVPTGGGKTRLASAMLKAIGKKSGLVLWMVPTTAIMDQTEIALKNKDHDVRRMLDIVSNNRVVIMKKNERLTKNMMHDNLCIMLLMQQSTNRVNKNELKIEKPNGIYSDYFPAGDDKKRVNRLLEECPGLYTFEDTNIPINSLVNVFKMKKPVVILDEAHKASAKSHGKWAEYVNKLGPSMVIELSATPNENESNILAVVTGKELQEEEMIKKKILVDSSESSWKALLTQASHDLEDLDAKARKHDKYIRPIMVIRVEIVDEKLRNKDSRIHALDVRDYLINTMGVHSEEVAIKTGDLNELKGKDLMDEDSHVRYIITQNSLVEGWDCPFAYMLVILDNLKNERALTQLLGRIMRQPYTKYTGVDDLDHCYVYCIHPDIEQVIALIQKQLNVEGLSKMKNYVQSKQEDLKKRTNTRRVRFEKLEINLPMVYHRENGKWVDIDYDKHIVYDIDWNGISVKISPQDPNALRKSNVAIIDTFTGGADVKEINVSGKEPKLFEWVSVVSGLVSNSWQAARIVRAFWKSTKLRPDEIYASEPDLQQILLEDLRKQIINKSEAIFTEKLNSNVLKFDIHASSSRFRMRGEYETLPDDGEWLKRKDAEPVQMSLDKPVYQEDFETDPEREFAGYLDKAEAIEWWHRVSARGREEYYLRGWKKDRIYPDFIAMFSKKDKRILRIYEIKGSDRDNSDTEYKERVLKLLQENLNCGNISVTGGRLEGDFQLVFDKDVGNSLKTGLSDGKREKAKNLRLVKSKATRTRRDRAAIDHA